MEGHEKQPEQSGGLTRYLSPLGAWALAFGCSIGWGCFFMPGTTFLPGAGPVGTLIGLSIGMLCMIVIARNYHAMMSRYPDEGGTYTFTKKVFGSDHGFLCAWFLCLTYIALIWANSTALALAARYVMPGALQWGFHYQIAGYDVYLGEALVSMAAVLLGGAICARSRRLAGSIQTALALVLAGGVLVCFAAAYFVSPSGLSGLAPAFSEGSPRAAQILRMVSLSPWAFVGFESIAHSAGEFSFSPKRSFRILLSALIACLMTYTLMMFSAALALPEGYSTWADYIADLPNLGGVSALPVFSAASRSMGPAGVALVSATVISALFTSIVGNTVAASRLIYAIAKDDILPKWFHRLDRDGSPVNAIRFITAISMFIPFLGRTAIGWHVDVSTISAAIAYGYTSAAVYVTAKREGGAAERCFGAAGVALSGIFGLFLLVPELFSGSAMATESYLILAAWSISGFLFFRIVFHQDTARRFGQSIVVWVALLSLIFYTSLMWMRQATYVTTERVVTSISDHYRERLAETGEERDAAQRAEEAAYLGNQLRQAAGSLDRNSRIQMAIMVLALGVMFSVYSAMRHREKQLDIERAQALESSRAKGIFLSNMSHDLRTPMNAIIGYTELAQRENVSAEEMREYLRKIGSSGQHLLALINDALEMSRIESGRMDLEPVPADLVRMMYDMQEMFSAQMEKKQIEFTVETLDVTDRWVMCDRNRLNRVLLNLLSNACKFTPDGGHVRATLAQTEANGDMCGYELRVKDDGIGMSPEFAEHVFTAFERERTSTVSGIQGTGLGMSITKSILDLMGGSIRVITAPGKGSEFIVRLHFPPTEGEAPAPEERQAPAETPAAPDFSKMRLLLVEDNDINREIATLILSQMGFALEYAENGRIAVDKVAASAPGDYDAVLMDIQMPVMDGHAAARAIRQLPDPALAKIPIIAMTANAFQEDVEAAAGAGMNGHIAKPLDVKLMTETLTRVLSQS